MIYNVVCWYMTLSPYHTSTLTCSYREARISFDSMSWLVRSHKDSIRLFFSSITFIWSRMDFWSLANKCTRISIRINECNVNMLHTFIEQIKVITSENSHHCLNCDYKYNVRCFRGRTVDVMSFWFPGKSKATSYPATTPIDTWHDEPYSTSTVVRHGPPGCTLSLINAQFLDYAEKNRVGSAYYEVQYPSHPKKKYVSPDTLNFTI